MEGVIALMSYLLSKLATAQPDDAWRIDRLRV
jgi:hypothetical protein